MTYEQALSKIHSLDKFGSRPGLDRIQMLFDRLGDDLLTQKFIHIAGTNGKGSVCQMISHVLTHSSYKTGLFISPYITDFRERIQINNQMVSKQQLTQAVEHILPHLDALNNDGIIITEFEFLTAVAFYIYKQQSCDIIVCETGLGGLLDSTNLIRSPLCSVLTKIDLDHTAILGDTIEEIAHQKCGIIKDGQITVSSAQCQSVSAIIRDTAEKMHNRLYFADDIELEDVTCSIEQTTFCYNGTALCLPLVGRHQTENAKTALCTLESLKTNGIINYSSSDLFEGLSKACNPARFELMCKQPLTVLDGAHNVNGMTAFKDAVQQFVDKKRVLLLGMLKDKDVDSALSLLNGMFDIAVVTNVPNPRNMDCYELSDICRRYVDKVVVQSSPKAAFDTAFDIAKENDLALCICGSLYLAGELRPYIIEKTKIR